MNFEAWLTRQPFALLIGWLAGLCVSLAAGLVGVLLGEGNASAGVLAQLPALGWLTLAGPLAPLASGNPTGVVQGGLCCTFVPLMGVPFIVRGPDDDASVARWLPLAVSFFCSFTWHLQGAMIYLLSAS